jgi:Protein of unknown function (DUF2516)
VSYFAIEGTISLIVLFVLLAVSIFAFVNALMFSAEAYGAAGKLTKPAWLIILGLGLAVQLIGLSLILSVAAAIAAFVYLADVRPALVGLRRR